MKRFAIAGIAFGKTLPADKKLKVLGVPNRVFLAVVGSAFCVLVEVGLNAVNALTWDYSWWSVRAPWLIFLVGYLPFFLVSFGVHDLESVRRKAFVAGGILAFDLAALFIFGGILRWI